MDILNKMDPFLNQGQYLQLTTVLLDALNKVEITDRTKDLTDLDNFKLLEMFLSAKEIEGRSDNTIHFYRLTINRLLKSTDKRVDQITTEDLRQHLTNHQRENNSSKTTIDNIRRIFSSFFSWLEDEDYILKNPVKRIHRVKKRKSH